jgi:hypothetical protein
MKTSAASAGICVILFLLGSLMNLKAQDTRTYSGNSPITIPMYKNVLTPGFTPPLYTEYVDGIATMTYSRANRKVRGTPFMQDEFMFGVLNLVDSVNIQGQKYRYNVYADEMQFILEEDTVSIFQPLKVNSIQFGERKFIYDLRMTGKDMLEAGYMEVLEEGNVSLLLWRTARLEVDEYVTNYMGGGGTGDLYYKHSKFYYIKTGDTAARKIRNIKDLIKQLPEHQSQVKKYLKSERIRFKDPEDLRKLVAYYNSL